MSVKAAAICVCFCLVLPTLGRRVHAGGLLEALSAARDCYTPEQAYEPKEECSVEKYYEGVDTTSAEALHAKLKGHRVLLYGTTREDLPEYKCADVWKALDFLDENKENSTKVDLIYSKFPTEKTGKMTTYWNREHVWPKSYGVSCKFKEKRWSNTRKGVKCAKKKKYVEDNGPFTDLHHLYPSHAQVNSDRSSEYFDECTPRTCNYDNSVHDGYTADEQDAGESNDNITFWQPPRKSRGVVARAMFYMALRYNGDEINTFDLTLTDSPSYCNTALGKLSAMKKWHKDFPPTEAEKQRNKKACWMQGNRNPFVDYPDLVEKLFGADASPHLVNAHPGSCDRPNTSPRAAMCDPDAGWIDLCDAATKPEWTNRN